MQTDLLDILRHIDPAILDYNDWLAVGMALKHEGYTANVWDDWSARDSARYHPGECYTKWLGFREEAGTIVTGGTIVQLARDQGWSPSRSSEGRELDWDAVINDDLVIVDPNWIEEREFSEPVHWNPAGELIRYLETLFESTENVGYVTESWEKDGRYMPTKGAYDRTAGQLIEELSKCNGDIGAVIGDYKEQVGAWIRFNPLDGQGVKNENVTDYRFALVESDVLPLEQQNAILRELELPIACLVFSGKKSIHAIVRIEAATYEEYRKRVDYLYEVCEKNGLKIDRQNRNPSRLSRMPGIIRNGSKQFLVDTNIGKGSWAEWHEWIEGVNDDLPDPEQLTTVWDNLPELAPPLIDGVLRQGHKMLLAGPSKAGKSYSLIQLCIGIAEGKSWLGWDCAKGRVLYVNLELDRASCLHRFRDVYKALGWSPSNVDNIDIWNLRGKAVPMDRLAPKLIRRSQKKGYIAVVIDPIYKVITGDENAADQMAHFTNQFDKVCTELGSAVIYCHHHSKGYQGQKRSMDRASGSGVFARDPDALLDMTELEVTEDIRSEVEGKAVARLIGEWIKRYAPDYYDCDIKEADREVENLMTGHANRTLTKKQQNELAGEIFDLREEISRKTAWRIEGTLREFAQFKPVDIWFDYPIHRVDTGALEEAEPESDTAPWKKALSSRKSTEERAEKRKNELEIAFSSYELDGYEQITLGDLADEMEVSKDTVKRRIREHKGFKMIVEQGKETVVVRKDRPCAKTSKHVAAGGVA